MGSGSRLPLHSTGIRVHTAHWLLPGYGARGGGFARRQSLLCTDRTTEPARSGIHVFPQCRAFLVCGRSTRNRAATVEELDARHVGSACAGGVEQGHRHAGAGRRNGARVHGGDTEHIDLASTAVGGRTSFVPAPRAAVVLVRAATKSRVLPVLLRPRTLRALSHDHPRPRGTVLVLHSHPSGRAASLHRQLATMAPERDRIGSPTR